MGAVIAGWAAGYIMGIATTIAVVYIVTQLSRPGALERWVDTEVARPLLGVPVFVGASLVWTIVGLILGSIYEVGGLADTRGALGTPSIGFAGSMAALGLMPVGILSAMWWRWWWIWLLLAVLFTFSFGWVMPVLAGQW